MKYKRLKYISSLINKDERVLDVGTDHALLPIMLIKEGITTEVIASDINKEPLSAAINNIDREGYSDVIKTKLLDGIKGIGPNDYDVIVIAGMGGNTISEIIKQENFNGRYIIHSTTSIELVRETIMSIGHKIVNESVIYEGKVHNVIIETQPGNCVISEKELFMGPSLINKVDESIINYYEHLLSVFERNAELSNDDNLKINERNWLKEKIWNEKN